MTASISSSTPRFLLFHDTEPELGRSILLQPKAQNLLGAVAADAQRDVHRLAADQPFVADLHRPGVEESQRSTGSRGRACEAAIFPKLRQSPR